MAVGSKHRLTAALLTALAGLLISSLSMSVAAEECSCWTVATVVCGADGNSYQNKCFAECQGVPVLAQGPCTTTSTAGAAMAQAFAPAAAGDESLVAAMRAYGVQPLTVQQLDGVAAAAASVVQGFDTSLPARIVTAADMLRFNSQGLVLVGVVRPSSTFNPAAPPVPDDVELGPDEPYENFGATEAFATLDGLLFKPRSLARHATAAAVAAAKAAAEAAAAIAAVEAQQDSAFGTIPAKLLGLVAMQPFLPADMKAQSKESVELDDAGDTASGNVTASDFDQHANNGTDIPDPGSPEGDEDTAGPLEDEVDGISTGAAAQLGRRLLKVFAPDNRVELVSRQKTLIRAVGRITYDIGEDSYFCSGALIGRHTVLTAAHCVMSVDTTGLTASGWKFSPDHNRMGSDPRFGRAVAAAFHFDTRFWTSGKWWLWDIAVVVLEQPLGRKTGYFGVGYKPKGYSGSMYTAGYPGDKPLWSFWWIPGGNRCSVNDTDGFDTVMTHKCDTYPGQSGSPMWIPGTSTILGVVSWEASNTNGACAVNSFWYRFIRNRRHLRPAPAPAKPP